MYSESQNFALRIQKKEQITNELIKKLITKKNEFYNQIKVLYEQANTHGKTKESNLEEIATLFQSIDDLNMEAYTSYIDYLVLINDTNVNIMTTSKKRFEDKSQCSFENNNPKEAKELYEFAENTAYSVNQKVSKANDEKLEKARVEQQAEEKARVEQAKAEAEEKARVEQAKAEAEEKARVEQAKAEAEAEEKARVEQQAKAKFQNIISTSNQKPILEKVKEGFDLLNQTIQTTITQFQSSKETKILEQNESLIKIQTQARNITEKLQQVIDKADNLKSLDEAQAQVSMLDDIKDKIQDLQTDIKSNLRITQEILINNPQTKKEDELVTSLAKMDGQSENPAIKENLNIALTQAKNLAQKKYQTQTQTQNIDDAKFAEPMSKKKIAGITALGSAVGILGCAAAGALLGWQAATTISPFLALAAVIPVVGPIIAGGGIIGAMIAGVIIGAVIGTIAGAVTAATKYENSKSVELKTLTPFKNASDNLKTNPNNHLLPAP